MNSINHASLDFSLPLTPTINGMSSYPKDIDLILKAVNEEPHKSKGSRKGPDTLWVSKPRDNPSDSSLGQLNDLTTSHVTDRVSQKIGQGRVLPSWTSRNRPTTLSKILPTQFTIGRKRQPLASDDFSELPSKRVQASQKDNGVSFILAEADHQPCQKQ